MNQRLSSVTLFFFALDHFRVLDQVLIFCKVGLERESDMLFFNRINNVSSASSLRAPRAGAGSPCSAGAGAERARPTTCCRSQSSAYPALIV